VVQFDSEASQTRDYCVAKERDTSRGSARSFTAQRTLVQDDNQTTLPPEIGKKEVTQVEQYTITGRRRTFPPLMVTELSLLPVEAASEFP
jgi:hypothetical protein